MEGGGEGLDLLSVDERICLLVSGESWDNKGGGRVNAWLIWATLCKALAMMALLESTTKAAIAVANLSPQETSLANNIIANI